MVRRAELERIGGFDPAFSVLADWDLWLRLSTSSRGAACVEPLTGYVFHNANMHLDLDLARADFRKLQEKHSKSARAVGSRIGGEDWRRWLAFASRRNGRRHLAAARYLAVGLRYASPRDIARSAGVLFGESAMALGRRTPDSTTRLPRDDVRWLDQISDGSSSRRAPE